MESEVLNQQAPTPWEHGRLSAKCGPHGERPPFAEQGVWVVGRGLGFCGTWSRQVSIIWVKQISPGPHRVSGGGRAVCKVPPPHPKGPNLFPSS